jgi:ABC-2 type transport system ATP-binding protein
VPQETALYEELSAWENLDFHADLFGMPRKEKKARIMQMLELVQLQERKGSRVGTFSGGMKRRLAMARALLHDPHLLYLDEPTLGVDVQSRRAIWDYILSLRDQGKTVLITTNYLEEAQVLTSGELARIWLQQRGMHRAILPLWLPGKMARAMRQGAIPALNRRPAQ